jgi:hypothetical protein
LQYFPTVHAWQHHIQDRELIALLEREVKTVGSVASQVNGETSFAQALAQVFASLAFIFNDQNPHVLSYSMAGW